MSDSDQSDGTWEDFFGASADLMPSIMGAFDAYIENNTNRNDQEPDLKPSTPKKSPQASGFANLSPCVQKILSNVPDQELNRRFASEETLETRRQCGRPIFRSMRSPEKQYLMNKSTESLDIISPNVQKMISNFPDAELVFPSAAAAAADKKSPRNHSFLHAKPEVCETKISHPAGGEKCDGNGKTFLYHSDCSKSGGGVNECDSADADSFDDNKNSSDSGYGYNPRPLGSYLHTSPHGIASRTPVGRKNMGKYLQVPSESSVGTTSSTTSSEVSRPVSLTSLGSCSSSGSSGPHMPGSAYLASAESLDSDPEPTGSQGSADSGIAEQLAMTAEARVLQEVLDTETVYVADLNDVIKGYLQPWKGDPDCPLAEHISHLFSNVEEIYRFNSSFLEQLRDADCDPTRTANVFIHNDSGFSVYNEYCANYPRTMEVIGELTRNEDMASLFRERQMALGHPLPLGSYLLKPVQRILKYHLLLQRLSKQCEPQHKPTVDLALTTMTSVAADINNMKRKHEHAVRVHEIQSQLYGWIGPDLTTLGDLIAEGTFRVNGARGRRQVFLFDKVLLMAKPKQDNVFTYKSHVMCSNLMLLEQVRGEPLSFQVLPFDNPRLHCTLRARSLQHKKEWTLQIKRVILENYSAVIPNHARQLVMQLGQDVQECEDTTDKWSPLNKSSTPYYLERRSRVRKSRDLSSRRASSQDRTFPTFGKWRRKSEPGMVTIPQYNVKTMPKKISKMKKAKESGTKFYTDLSDSENCEIINAESVESLETTPPHHKETPGDDTVDASGDKTVGNNLEQIVTDLLMQNQEFHKVMNRPRRNNPRGSEPEPTVWFEESRTSLPTKADSLPRSFQLNDQVESDKDKEVKGGVDESPNEIIDRDEQQENDLSSQLDDSEYPVNKIYRKSAIRLSLVQRIRALVSEEDHRHDKYPTRKLQGSKSMGEKIAHPDYADPQKLFVNSCNSSRTNLSVELSECDIMDAPEPLDMTISETEVLNEFDRRLNDSSTKPVAGSPLNDHSSHREQTKLTDTIEEEREHSISSQNSDGYYESMLDKSLVEEYTKDESGKLVAKQDSFKNHENTFLQKYRIIDKQERHTISNQMEQKCFMKRPTKPPPPIPTKPTRLINYNATVSTKSEKIITRTSNETINSTSSCNKAYFNNLSRTNQNGNQDIKELTTTVRSTSWVKTMVGRFE